jgi:hypothetical protein
MSEIPFERLGIPEAHRKPLLPDAPLPLRLAAAKGSLPVPPSVALAMCFVLLNDSDGAVKSAAKTHLSTIPTGLILPSLNADTHPKLLEFLVENRLQDDKLLERVVGIRLANPRTLRLIARHGSAGVLDSLSYNQERMLVEPHLLLEIEKNPAMSADLCQRVESFLRLHHVLDEVNAARESTESSKAAQSPAPKASPTPTPATPVAGGLEMFDLEALGLGDDGEAKSDSEEEDLFDFSFDESADTFDLSMTEESEDGATVEPEEKLSLERELAQMKVGQKIKLAYTGNLTTRKLLLRDANKLVSSAVVKSGRMTENEILKAAGNRNIPADILKYIANNKAVMRKYPIRAALATNPKTPVPIALKLMRDLSKADLRALSMNKNVAGVVFTTAGRLYRQKYQK